MKIKHLFPVWFAFHASPCSGSVHSVMDVQLARGCFACPGNPQVKKQSTFLQMQVLFSCSHAPGKFFGIFHLSPPWKNRARREAGDPKCRHDEHTVLQMHPNSLAAVHVCEGSTAGKFCQYSAHIRKIKGPDYFPFLVWVFDFISPLSYIFFLWKRLTHHASLQIKTGISTC